MPPVSTRLYRHSLLILMIGALLFVRLVDLHWHQPLCPAPAQLADQHASHLAGAAAPQDESQHYADVSLTGDDGFAQQLPILPMLASGLVLLLLLRLSPAGSVLPRQRRVTPPRRSGTRPPPSRGPPALMQR